jgi:hypothetical protein
MSANQGPGFGAGGNFLGILGIVYLVRLIRERRRQRHAGLPEQEAPQ